MCLGIRIAKELDLPVKEKDNQSVADVSFIETWKMGGSGGWLCRTEIFVKGNQEFRCRYVESEMPEILKWRYYVGYFCLFLLCGNRNFAL